MTFSRPLAALLLAALPLFAEVRQIFPPGAKPVGPYSPGILAGDYLYVSGQGARDAEGKFAPTAEGVTRQTMKNVQDIVEAAGFKMDQVVYAQVYLKDMAGFEAMNKVWKETFPAKPPARATLGVARMPTETPVEITVVAYKDKGQMRDVLPGPAPYSPGMLTGDRFYLAGVVGRRPDGVIPSSPEEQVEAAFARAGEVLKAAGLGFEHLVFTNVYITAALPRGVMDKIYARHFKFGDTPARATIQVPSLPGNTNIEITGVAVRNLRDRKSYKPRNMAPSPTASPCVAAGDTLYCSAKSAFIPGPNSGIFAPDVEGQVRQTMRNLLDGLEEMDLGFKNVVATNVYVDQLDEFARMNRIYALFFPQPYPTRTTVQPLPPVERKTGELGQQVKLEEISLIAVK